jgi:hypothetical protein
MSSFSRLIRKATHRLATAGIAQSHVEGGFQSEFVARCRAMHAPRVAELGTKRSIASRSTRHDDWIPNAGEYLGVDLEAGLDVDIVADVHRLTAVTGCEQFDAIISCSTFEHVKYPHVAAHEVMKALRIGGLLLIQTHQSFPLHAYPHDYFRFSREALASLFGSKMGFRVIATDYEFPVKLYSPREPGVVDMPSYLNVCLYGEKTHATPDAYIYDFDAV